MPRPHYGRRVSPFAVAVIASGIGEARAAASPSGVCEENLSWGVLLVFLASGFSRFWFFFPPVILSSAYRSRGSEGSQLTAMQALA
jgi:hypothetical protein